MDIWFWLFALGLAVIFVTGELILLYSIDRLLCRGDTTGASKMSIVFCAAMGVHYLPLTMMLVILFVSLWKDLSLATTLRYAHPLLKDPDNLFVVLLGIVLLGTYGALAPVFIKRGERKRRLRNGICLRCGYDIHASIAVGRLQCPECGFPNPHSDSPS